VGLKVVVYLLTCKGGTVGANSQQGVALLVFFTSFTLASAGMLRDGNIVLLLLAAVTFVASVALFLKAKPLEE
jgi:hypothetical protein